MKKSISLGTFLVITLLAGSLFASGVSLTGIGARATALGGAYRAVSNDWSAMYWNPAGLTQIEGMHFGTSFELIMPTSKYTLGDGAPGSYAVYKTTETENDPRTFYIPAAGFVYGKGNMSFGLSFYVPFGLGAKWNMFNTASYNNDYPEFDFEDDLKIIDIHPSFAYKIKDKLSIGVGFSFTLADIIIRSPASQLNPFFLDPEAETLISSVIEPMGLATDLYRNLQVDKELEGDGTGMGFNFGVQYKLTEDITLGLSANWYSDISLDGKISATAYLPKIDDETALLLSQGLNGFNEQLPDPFKMTQGKIDTIMGAFLGSQIPVYDKAKGDAKLALPMTVGGGIAYTGIENLLISADISWTQWSCWDSIKIEIEQDQSTSYLIEKWEDGIRFSMGLEYKLMDLLKLRAGYYTEPSAIPNETLTITIPDLNRRHAINFGIGYCLGPVDLFASYEKIFVGDNDVAEWEDHNMAGKYKMNVNNIMFGLGYNF